MFIYICSLYPVQYYLSNKIMKKKFNFSSKYEPSLFSPCLLFSVVDIISKVKMYCEDRSMHTIISFKNVFKFGATWRRFTSLTGLHDCMWSLNWRAVRLSFMKIQLYCLNYTNFKINIA